MTIETTPDGDPVGPIVAGWTPRPRPPKTPMIGRTCRLEPVSAERHGPDLFEAYRQDKTGRLWTYLSVGPFETLDGYLAWARAAEASEDPVYYAVIDTATGKAVGTASFLRIDPANGVIEVGWITWSPLMQRTAVSTEAMALMMARVFDELGYRRYEWKCNDLNGPSKSAASRLGFTFEGVFRQAAINKGRSRDTSWFSVIDGEWPVVKKAFEAWLDPANFDADGRQRRSLQDIRATLAG